MWDGVGKKSKRIEEEMICSGTGAASVPCISALLLGTLVVLEAIADYACLLLVA